MVDPLLLALDRVGQLAVVPLAAGENLGPILLQRPVELAFDAVHIRGGLGWVEEEQALITIHWHGDFGLLGSWFVAAGVHFSAPSSLVSFVSARSSFFGLAGRSFFGFSGC